jgi:hypothetical protein
VVEVTPVEHQEDLVVYPELLLLGIMKNLLMVAMAQRLVLHRIRVVVAVAVVRQLY